MEAFLNRLRVELQLHRPELLPLFETMAGEAIFARDWLADDLAQLPRGARLLEVGGGSFLLSCQLAEEGFAVTSIEPVGEGFGEFHALAHYVLEQAHMRPTIAPCRAEDFTSEERFDFAFSINVMEHVDDVAAVIRQVTEVLKPGASYRFFCPNYLFPYEPHFNIPLAGSKQLTERLFRNRIYGHPMSDAAGVWKSLNWITVPHVRRVAAHLSPVFNKTTLVWILERALRDPQFAARRAPWMITIIRAAVGLHLHRMAQWIPAVMQPIMDVRLTRGSNV